MNEHLPKVFSMHVEKVGEDEGPVESQDTHVINEDVALELMARKVEPEVARVEGPWFVGDDIATVEKGSQVIGKLPTGFVEFGD